MESKRFYKNELFKTLAYAGIAFFVIFSLVSEVPGSEETNISFETIAVALAFSGIPSGWTITGRLFGDWFIAGPIVLVVLLIRFMISVVIGVFALPVRVIYLIYMICTAPSDTDE